MDTTKIVLLVIDEAHRASGNYAYCNIIQEIENKGKSGFRILALTATPVSRIDNMQQVIYNLRCSALEVRGEDDEEIKKYTYQKDVTELIVPKFDHIKELDISLNKIID